MELAAPEGEGARNSWSKGSEVRLTEESAFQKNSGSGKWEKRDKEQSPCRQTGRPSASYSTGHDITIPSHQL